MATLTQRDALSAPTLDTNEMADRVMAAIIRRTCGQVRELHVEANDDQVVLTGRSRTYHVKQLAQEAVLNEIGVWPRLVNEIMVF